MYIILYDEYWLAWLIWTRVERYRSLDMHFGKSMPWACIRMETKRGQYNTEYSKNEQLLWHTEKNWRWLYLLENTQQNIPVFSIVDGRRMIT